MSFKQLWQEPKNQSKTYNILNNIFSAITHGIGFGLAVAGLVILIVRAAHTGSALRVTAFTLYGSSLVILYLFSTLYHSLIFTRARRVFQIFDHSSIFILITGTYTPYTLVAIGGVKGWIMFGIILALAIFGILFYIFNQGKHVILDTILYVLMGWIVIIASSTLYPVLGPTGFWLLVWGGVAYTVGAVLFSMCGVPYIHVIWHMFVLLGSILMYFSILLYV
ncbi:hemolysin III [Lactobacillus taiwanensis DSM 21401]|uniref:PAQR family membrane homeostasis protein TrhA n=1 Tax=Lactobacillus taiwanensis TaxID=508451 RepID=UPI0006EEC715|nr:hemolysin III family protein [Lactobacillus taiwanensis]KRM98040.1 hemolysin III [Lactobacillus taiwanensis DSM 21401]OYS17297.1 hemolysin III [Lactobacillus taiwanensis]OYS17448.1 hemolysin III [Lactobacillus taiwanensis]